MENRQQDALQGKTQVAGLLPRFKDQVESDSTTTDRWRPENLVFARALPLADDVREGNAEPIGWTMIDRPHKCKVWGLFCVLALLPIIVLVIVLSVPDLTGNRASPVSPDGSMAPSREPTTLDSSQNPSEEMARSLDVDFRDVELDRINNSEWNDVDVENIHVVEVNADGVFSDLYESQAIGFSKETTGTLWVEYCADQVLRVSLASSTETKPENPIVQVSYGLNALLRDPTASVGFASATGGYAGNTMFCHGRLLKIVHEVLLWPRIVSPKELVYFNRP